jgi:hypothetical protein
MNHTGSFMKKSHICAVPLLALLAMVGAQPVTAQGSNATELCTPDAMRLCNEFIPDRERIIACMKAKRSQLSAGCLAAFGGSKSAKAKRRHDGSRKVKKHRAHAGG